jgi:hypothetical protein
MYFKLNFKEFAFQWLTLAIIRAKMNAQNARA